MVEELQTQPPEVEVQRLPQRLPPPQLLPRQLLLQVAVEVKAELVEVKADLRVARGEVVGSSGSSTK
jgi:hypothetical protein